MRSPFKFLDAYTLEDKDNFFGRDKEIEALYEMVFKTPLSLVYGLSGTGKTSLIQCGLAGKFDGPDWNPFWIRKNEDINKSLNQALQAGLKGKEFDNIVDKVSYLFRYYLRPVYLIFDQFEELFIIGEPEEQLKFIESIKDLLAAELPCKILFIMREEYIGQLYDFEKQIPTLFDYRLRVEQMNRTKVKDVMEQSFNKFNIHLEGSKKERLEEMVTNISGGKSRIQLPYLQVYLDMLYRDDYERTYGNKEIEEELPALTFTQDEIAELGAIDDVLEKFLRDQEKDLQEKLSQEFHDFPEEGVRKILDAFVTESGTKRPMPYKQEGDEIVFEEFNLKFFPKMETKTLHTSIRYLEQSRILRDKEDSIEVAHDTLALVIDQNRTDEQRRQNEIRTSIRNSYQDFKASGEYMSHKKLLSMEADLPKIVLEDDLQRFVEDSRAEAVRKQEEEANKQKEDLAREKALFEEQVEKKNAINSARRAKYFSILAIILVIASIISLYFAVSQTSNVHATLASKYKLEEKYDLSIEELEKAKGLNFFSEKSSADFDSEIAELKELQIKFNADSALVDSAIYYEKQGELGNPAFFHKALEKYKEAIDQVDYDRSKASTRLMALENKMQDKFDDYIQKGDAFREAGGILGFEDARNAYQQALMINPGSERANRKLESL